MRLPWSSLISLVLWLVPGCKEDQACTPGKSEACVGPGGCVGGQVCDQSGAQFGACVCSSTSDGGTDSTTDAEPAVDSGIDSAVDSATEAEVGDAGPCNLLLQTGCGTGQKCMAAEPSGGSEPVNTCVPAGTAAEGAACTTTPSDDCAAGLVCVGGECRKYCDRTVTTSCTANFACQDYAVGTGAMSVCIPRCDPVTQVRLSDGAAACGSPDPTAPTRGCFGQPNKAFTCVPAPFDRKHGEDAAGSTGIVYVNSCAPGYQPLLRKTSDTASAVICVAFCRPAETHKTATANAGGTAPNTCAARGATGAECRHWWFLEDSSLPKTLESNTVGFCVDYANYTYDHDKDASTAAISWPSCTTLANTDANGDGVADHLEFACGPRL